MKSEAEGAGFARPQTLPGTSFWHYYTPPVDCNSNLDNFRKIRHNKFLPAHLPNSSGHTKMQGSCIIQPPCMEALHLRRRLLWLCPAPLFYSSIYCGVSGAMTIRLLSGFSPRICCISSLAHASPPCRKRGLLVRIRGSGSTGASASDMLASLIRRSPPLSTALRCFTIMPQLHTTASPGSNDAMRGTISCARYCLQIWLNAE